jgi:hypothetical protein
MDKSKITDGVKIVKLMNGDDIVTILPKEQLGDKSPFLRLSKPLQIKYVPQFTDGGLKDYVALIRWTNYTHDEIVSIPKDKILTITNASNEMSKSYNVVSVSYSKLEEKQKNDKIYSQERMSDDKNEEYNEIFDEFRDIKKTVH